jgi:hypothetical protein
MDWNNMQMWQYFALGGGALLVVAIILYFVPAAKLRLPAVVTAGFAGTALGLALGVLLMASLGYKPHEESPAQSGDSAADAAKMGPPGGMPRTAGMGGGMPKMGGMGGPPGGGGGFGGPPSSKVQLANLVTALDRVADRPVTITLTPEQRQTIAAQLKGLDQADELSDADAQAKLDAIHKVVEKDKGALEAVGYRGPAPAGKGGGGKGGFGAPKEQPPNPFKQGPAGEHLKSLMDRLAAKK